jgi:hypothetical protein
MNKLNSICILVFISVIMFSCGNNSKQENQSTSSEKNVYSEHEHNCSECNATKVESKMIHSTGDVISEGKEYWVCKGNNMKCINSRYEKIKKSRENPLELVEYSKNTHLKKHRLCKFYIELPETMKLSEMYGDSSLDYCDYEVKFDDDLVSLQIHSLNISRFEFNKISELYDSAIENSKLEVTYKIKKTNWFVISGIRKDGKISYWKRILGDKFVSDLLIVYEPKSKLQIEPYIGEISNSFISD